ncbi:hypothetical protein PIB30_093066 [Stylosanthes scabra]|uniref:Protein FLUORESCENT IN BLUE LIGHT, chloroplastic-like n=1 Tax=Stylosanthes scabra TaxID=79078 RepID=A0ABU6VVE1_9FABA|nr:hypothetical protein [Stylosanthes scabra]
MAVLLRSSAFLSRPRSHPHFSSHNKPHFTRKFVCLSFKLVPSLKLTCECHDASSAGIRIPMEHMQQRLSSLMLMATNVLMYSVPSKALAETCEPDNSIFNMPILLAVALIGATVGGLLARQRKAELQKVNEQLLQINQALRKQAKIESYAPSLSYAPVGGRIPDNEVIIDPKKQELISKLKTGKNYLRNQQPDKAFTEFKIALELAQNLKDPIEEKKAARGLGLLSFLFRS